MIFIKNSQIISAKNYSTYIYLYSFYRLADIGPPEFTPGVPWPGLRAIDPETDPNITPGSAAQIKSISVVNKVSDADQV